MKKYLLLLATAFIAISFSSCDPEPKTDDPSKIDKISLVKQESAIYYDRKYADNVGFYSVEMSNEDGQKLRLDMFGTISTNAANAKLVTGSYVFGTSAEHTLRTFFAAENESDEFGSILKINGKAYLITGGKYEVKITAGKTSISGEIETEDQTIPFTFNNVLKFENQSQYPPHPSEVINAKMAWGLYYGLGQNSPAIAKAGQFTMFLVKSGDITNENTHALQITGLMPIASDNDNAMLPEGTYKIVSDADLSADPSPFKLIAGSIEDKEIVGSGEFESDEDGAFNYGWVASEGTMVVSKSGDTYTITANFKGKRADQSGIVGKGDPEEFKFSYTGTMDPFQNQADPMTNLKGDKNVGKITTKTAIVQIPNIKGYNVSTWLYWIFGEGLSVNKNGNEMSFVGTGDFITFYLQGPKTSSELAIGEFPISSSYYNLPDETKNVALPATAFSNFEIGPEFGTWYGHWSGEIDQIAGGVPSQGKVIGSLEGDIYNMEFEFFDKGGNKISGSFEVNKNDIEYLKPETRSLSGLRFTPTFNY